MEANLDINKLLDQVTDVDPDIRFMALSDIDKLLSRPKSQFLSNSYKLQNIANALIDLLKDVNPDVQNQSVKNFKSLGSVLDESNITLIDQVLKKLFSLVKEHQQKQKKDNDIAMTGSIFTMALRYFLQNLKASSKRYNLSQLIVSDIFPYIVNEQTTVIPSLDYIEILFDLIKFNGNALNNAQIRQATVLLINSAYKSYGVLSSKAINTLGLLIDYLNNSSQAEKIINDAFLNIDEIKAINPRLSTFEVETVRLNLLLNITKKNASKFVSQFGQIFKVLRDDLYLDRFEADVDMDNDQDMNDDTLKFDEVRDISLNCIENLAVSLYDVLGPYVDDLLSITKNFLKYDPYNLADDEDDEDDDIPISDDEDVDFSDEEYYDDEEDNDDISWRLRKEAAKVIGLVAKQADSATLKKLFNEGVIDLLAFKLNDSNELVVTEILSSLTIVVKAVNTSSDLFSTFVSKIPIIVKSFAKNLGKAKNVNALNNYLKFAAELVYVGDRHFSSAYIVSILSSIQKFKDLNTSNFRLDNELIDLYTTIFKQHSLIGIKEKVDGIISDLAIGVNNPVRNSSLSALDASLYLIDNFATHKIRWTEFEHFKDLFISFIDKASSKNYDSELREKSTLLLIRVFGGLNLENSEYSNQILEVVKGNLVYDSLSESTLKSLITLFRYDVNKHDLPNEIPNQWLSQLVNILLGFIEKANQRNQASIVSDSLKMLLNIVENRHLDEKLSEDEFVKIIEVVVVKEFGDSKDYQRKLLIIGILLSRVSKCNISLVEQIIEILQVGLQSKSVAENSAPLLYVAKSLTHRVNGENLFDDLFEDKYTSSSIVAEVLSIIAIQAHLTQKIVDAERRLLSDIKDQTELIFTLNFLGNVAKFKKLDIDFNVFLDLLKEYQTNDQVMLVIARNIGKFISRDIDSYLPRILETLEASKGKDDEESKSLRYSLLLAVKQELEIKYNKSVQSNNNSILNDTITEASSHINESNALKIWQAIFEIEKKNDETSTLDINELSIASESLSLILITNQSFISHLAKYTTSEKKEENTINYLVLNTIRQLINLEFFKSNGSMDLLVDPNFVEYLKLNLGSELIVLKQISLNLLLGIIHNYFEFYYKSNLIQGELLEPLLNELKPRVEFIRKLQIGPFKHKIDDGIELRKTVYEIFFSVVSNDFLAKDIEQGKNKDTLLKISSQIVDFGLKDSSEIILITNLMIQKIVKVWGLILFEEDTILDNYITRNTKIFGKKLSDKATKQQIDEQNENIKSNSKTVVTINNIVQAHESDIDNERLGKWRKFYRENLYAIGNGE